MKAVDDNRKHLLSALTADLIGPYDPRPGPQTGAEVLRLPPLRWYLTGFLIPAAAALSEAATSGDEEEELDAGDELEQDAEPTAEPGSKQRPMLPSSIGLSVLLPMPMPMPNSGAGEADSVVVELAWGEYVLRSSAEEVAALCRARGMNPDKYLQNGERKLAKELWERVAIPPMSVRLDLSAARDGKLVRASIAEAPGVYLEYRIEAISPSDAETLRIGQGGAAVGARALSVFLVNARAVAADPERDRRGFSRELNRQTLFQVELALRAPMGLLHRPDAHFANSGDLDDSMIDLQFRNEVEWAVGHGISSCPIARDGRDDRDDARPSVEQPAVGVRAMWLPHTRVVRVQPCKVEGVAVDMETLATLADAAAVSRELGGLPSAYGEWIAAQAKIPLTLAEHRTTQARLVAGARAAQERIADGIRLLETDAELRQAFCWANEAMAKVARRRRPDSPAHWHLFQLAFVLLNLRGIRDPEHGDRRLVELLFFPTGGGKTEAYLGVIATSLLLRRMQGQERPDEGLGVGVILRYTLRLLTLDQLERASALICSLELLRREHPKRLGSQRFAIGLWVGRSGSPNTMADAKKQITDYRGKTAESKGSPFPLVRCPWCEAAIEGRCMDTLPRRTEPTRTVVVCANSECEFSSVRRGQPGTKVGELPILFVDEHIYSELPAFIVSTVDKFAMLTHRGVAGKLFGRVHSYTDQRDAPRQFWSGGDSARDEKAVPDSVAESLPDGLRPPELIVQDELHLISGPLGTMVGLFETLIEELCQRSLPSGQRVGPKLIAATATVRRASEQIQALYAREVEQTRLFPPQGVDAWQTFFAERDRDANERMYVGLAATGRSLKRILLQSYLVLLGGAELLYQQDPAAADPYMSVAGYFNSLRELGGMRRIVDDDIYTRVRKLDERTPEDHRSGAGLGRGPWHQWMRKREIGDPIELTSRVRTSQLTEDKGRLATSFHEHAAAKAAGSLAADALAPVDVLLASNMISVGVDISRLGLMVVAGQPKTTSEYIQSTSRVGRDDKRPGFVLTVYNVHRPRDRSHYEHFMAYHESFYRYVEAQSVTPFSLPALDRSLASVVVGMVRHLGSPRLAAPLGAGAIELIRAATPKVVEVLAARAKAQPDRGGASLVSYVATRSTTLVDKWRAVVSPTERSRGSQADYCYSPFEQRRARAKALLRTPEDDATRQEIGPRDDQYPFVAPTSMRDVEPTVAIWVRRRPQQNED